MSHFRHSSTLILVGVIACFVLSGFAALLYQTAWMRQFSLVFGTSELAIAAVLAAYMGGLSLGASVAARFVNRVRRPVLFYGLLEAGIALSALAVPLLLQLARLVYVGVLGGKPEPVDASGLGQSFFYLFIAFVVLAIPTTFMGATLPLLTKYVVKSKEQIGSRVGLLYATNTAGAIGGTVVAGFVLLPILGLNGTVWVGVLVNLIVFVLAAAIARSIGDHSEARDSDIDAMKYCADIPEESEISPGRSSLGGARFWILPIMLLSGANSFVYEVLWTRLLGHILGGSITAFSTMLAGFLGGIAMGSALAARFAKTREQATFIFVLVQCGIALTSILIYQILPLAIPETAGLKGNVLFAILILLPATVFIGATFPLAVRILAVDQRNAAPASARVYSWNTVGAILGATLAAFFLIPLLKYEGAIRVAVSLNAFLAVAAALLLGFFNAPLIKRSAGCALVFFLGTLIFHQPKMPESILRSSPMPVETEGEIVFYEVGRSATVIVLENDGQFFLRTNGLPEASASMIGTPPGRQNQLLLSVLPVLARPDAETMLIVGLGGGVALEGVPRSINSIDVVELEAEVVKANQFIGEKRALDPLKDVRINISINDARSALTLTDKKYDTIVSQPSHPWTAGASHLYTREFMALAKDHLTEGGVYLQWMNSSFVDKFLLGSLSATMLDVFPYVRMYQFHPGVLFFLGSDEPLEPEVSMTQTGRPLQDDVLGYLELGIGSVEDLLVALSMDQTNIEDFAKIGRVITDNNNEMATRSARAMDSGQTLDHESLYSFIRDYDPLINASSRAMRDELGLVDYSYIGRRLDSMGLRKRALDISNRLIDEGSPQGLVMIGLGMQQQGDRDESQKNLRLALAADPNDQQARYALLQPWFGSIFGGQQVPDYVQDELSNLKGTASDTVAGLMAVERGDMNGLVKLDAALASVLSSDLWYTTSVKLRAEWRIRLTSPGYQPRMANEATYLVDSAIALFLDIQLYILRAKSTFIAGDYVSTLATTRSMTRLVESQIERAEAGVLVMRPGTIDLRHSQLLEVQSVIVEITPEDDATRQDKEAVEESIRGLRTRLEKL